ncbi:aminotransferase class I/II-fold pyridoxal phosphate-dependent enzyme [Ekhidna sp.]
MNSYQKALQERQKQHLLRTLPLPPEGIDFYSNDYLGFAKSKELSKSIDKEIQSSDCTNGATGSRLLSGNSDYAEQVEQKVADFHQVESSLVYSSGYAANLGLISCLATRETTLICDELIHASLIDGARLGVSKKIKFKHNDVEDLSAKLQSCDGQKLVIVESVYSMDGDICPLEEITNICEQFEAMLIVDEAHSIAVYGEKGEGLTQALGLEEKVMARIVTYGKGPGIHGAAVVGPMWLKDYQVNFSRSLIFSTAPTGHHFAAISAFYDYLPYATSERKKLQDRINYFIEQRKESTLDWLDSPSQIQSLIIPGNENVIAIGNQLMDAGINALPIRKPSVAEGSERIRFCLHAYNTQEEIDLLFEILNK